MLAPQHQTAAVLASRAGVRVARRELHDLGEARYELGSGDDCRRAAVPSWPSSFAPQHKTVAVARDRAGVRAARGDAARARDGRTGVGRGRRRRVARAEPAVGAVAPAPDAARRCRARRCGRRPPRRTRPARPGAVPSETATGSALAVVGAVAELAVVVAPPAAKASGP